MAANGSNAGNALDQILDALGTAIENAGLTVAELSSAVAANPGSAAPIQTIVQPTAASCVGLRSGEYRYLDLIGGETFLVNVDAPALRITHAEGEEALIANGNCKFSIGETEPAMWFTSKSGVTLIRNGGSTATPALLIPNQTIALSDLAGDWNMLGYERDSEGQPYEPSKITFTLTAAGQVTAGADCDGLAACEPWEHLADISVNPEGGFNWNDHAPEGDTSRILAFKGADGQVSLYIQYEDGFLIGAKAQPVVLSPVGTIRKNYDISMGNNRVLNPTPDESATEVLSVDTANKTYTRVRSAGNPANIGDVEIFRVDDPRAGLAHRAANTTVKADGSPRTHSGIVAMSVAGTGLSAVVNLSPTPGFTYSFSVNRP